MPEIPANVAVLQALVLAHPAQRHTPKRFLALRRQFVTVEENWMIVAVLQASVLAILALSQRPRRLLVPTRRNATVVEILANVAVPLENAPAADAQSRCSYCFFFWVASEN